MLEIVRVRINSIFYLACILGAVVGYAGLVGCTHISPNQDSVVIAPVISEEKKDVVYPASRHVLGNAITEQAFGSEILLEDPPRIEILEVSSEKENSYQAYAAYLMGELFQRNNRFDKAADSFKKALSLQKDNPLYYETLGLLYSDLPEHAAQSIVLLEQAVELGTRTKEVFYRLGEHFSGLSDTKKALHYFQQYIQLPPSLVSMIQQIDMPGMEIFTPAGYRLRTQLKQLLWVYTHILKLYQQTGQDEQSRVLLQDLHAAFPNEAVYMIDLIESYQKDMLFQKALSLLYAINNVYELQEKDFIRLVNIYRKMILIPDFLPQTTADTLYVRICSIQEGYIKVNSATPALFVSLIALADMRKDIDALEKYAEQIITDVFNPHVLYQALHMLLRHKAYDSVRTLLESVQSKRPALFDTQVRFLHFALKIIEKNEEVYTELSEFVKKWPSEKQSAYYLKMAILMRDLNFPSTAVLLAKKSCTISPKSIPLLLQYADILLSDNQKQEVGNVFKTIVSIVPDKQRAIVYNAWGYTMLEMNGDIHRALELIQKSLKDDSNNPAYLDSAGWAYFQLGNMNKAGEYLLRALSLSRDEEILEHVGDYYSAIDKKDKARAFFMESYWMNPTKTLRTKIRHISSILMEQTKQGGN